MSDKTKSCPREHEESGACCGAENPDDATFCFACGHQFDEAAPKKRRASMKKKAAAKKTAKKKTAKKASRK